MILDRLENKALYRDFGCRLFTALEYLSATDFNSLENGKHAIDGDRLFAMVQRYAPRSPAEARWEAHRNYIDVQYIARGEECMGYAPLKKDLPIEEEYDAARDVVFYKTSGVLLPLSAGSFAVFTPLDIHAPGLQQVAPAECSEVLKVVVKCLWEG
jgi:biofilm protein TabA